MKQVSPLMLMVFSFSFGLQSLVQYAFAADIYSGHSPEWTSDANATFTTKKEDRAGLGGVSIGDSITKANEALGAPYRIINDASQWYFYGAYDDFVMVRFKAGVAHAIYSTNDTDGGAGVTLYTDRSAGGRIYAASVGVIGGASVITTEQIIFELTNAFRAQYGLSALVWSDLLGAVARVHSKDDMADRNFFGHADPDGKTLGDRLTSVGYAWRVCGENIDAGYSDGVRAMDGWINSKSTGHRDNILNTVVTELGIGWATGGVSNYYATYGTQNFGARR